jgi:hypothetical protein
MITGRYTIIVDNQVVAEADNVITTEGKNSILRYLAGIDQSWAAAIGIGSLSNLPNSPSAADLSLGFEFGRGLVTVKTVDYTNQDVIMKATLPASLAGKVYELGLFTQLNNSEAGVFSNRLISAFTSAEGWTAAPLALAYDSTNNRVGQDSIIADITSASTSQTYTLLNYNNDFSGYSASDSFGLTFITYYNYVASITIRFTNSAGTVISAVFTPASHTAGSNIAQVQLVKVLKSAFTNATADWSEIVKVEAVVTSNSSASATNRAKVALDGLQVFDNDTINAKYAMVSRAAISPVTKQLNVPMDVEYRMRFTL